MSKFVSKRLLYMIPVLLGVAFLVFSILSMTPGDPGSIILGITASKEDIAALNAEFGYDKPFLIRFFNYIGDIVFHSASDRIFHVPFRFYRNTAWDCLCGETVFRAGPYVRDCGAGVCLHTWILAGANADSGIFPASGAAAILRRRHSEAFYSAYHNHILRVGRQPAPPHQIRHA